MDHSSPRVTGATWRQMGDAEHGATWERFRERFQFDGSAVLPERAIADPVPSITFDLSRETGPGEPDFRLVVNVQALRCFATALSNVDELLVLESRHPTFRFRPSVEASVLTPRARLEDYPAVFVRGEYRAFVTPDMTEGTFGHPRESSLCVFGPRLVETLGASLATWLPFIRRDGRPGGPFMPVDPSEARRGDAIQDGHSVSVPPKMAKMLRLVARDSSRLAAAQIAAASSSKAVVRQLVDLVASLSLWDFELVRFVAVAEGDERIGTPVARGDVLHVFLPLAIARAWSRVAETTIEWLGDPEAGFVTGYDVAELRPAVALIEPERWRR